MRLRYGEYGRDMDEERLFCSQCWSAASFSQKLMTDEKCCSQKEWKSALVIVDAKEVMKFPRCSRWNGIDCKRQHEDDEKLFVQLKTQTPCFSASLIGFVCVSLSADAEGLWKDCDGDQYPQDWSGSNRGCHGDWLWGPQPEVWVWSRARLLPWIN